MATRFKCQRCETFVTIEDTDRLKGMPLLFCPFCDLPTLKIFPKKVLEIGEKSNSL